MHDAPELLSYASKMAPPPAYRQAAIILLIWGGIAAPSGFVAIPLLLLMPAISGDFWSWVVGLLTVLPFLAVLLLWAGFGVNALRGGLKLLRGHDADLEGPIGMNSVAFSLTLLTDICLVISFAVTRPWTWPDWPGFAWFTAAILIITGFLFALGASLHILRKCQRMQQFEEPAR